MQTRTHRILGYILLAAAVASLVPTVCRIYRFGFDNEMIPMLIGSLVIWTGSESQLAIARRKRREEKKEMQK